MIKKLPQTFHKRLKKYRELSGCTQQQVAKMLNISQQRYHAWEAGINEPNIEFIKKLSNIFGIKPGELLEDEIEYSEVEKKAMIVAKKLFDYLKDRPEELNKMKKIINSLTIDKKG